MDIKFIEHITYENIDCQIAGTFNEKKKNFARSNQMIREANNKVAKTDRQHPPILDHNHSSTLSPEERAKRLGLM